MHKTSVLFLFVLISVCHLLISCNESGTFIDFEKTVDLKAEEIQTENTKIGMPSRNMFIIEDNLIFMDGLGDYLIKIIKLDEGGELLEFGRKGMGPEEITFINGLDKTIGFERTFYINETLRHRVSFFNIDSIRSGNKKPVSTFSLPSSRLFDEFTPIASNRYLAESIFSPRFVLALYDSTFRILSESFEYPEELTASLNLLNPSFQTIALSPRIRLSPSGNRVMSYLMYTDFIELFSIEKDTLISTFRSYSYMKEIEVITPMKYINKNIRGGILRGMCTENYIYLLAHDHSDRLRQSDIFKGARHLYVLDWSGMPMNHFELDHDILLFTVVPDDQTMYAFTYGEEETKLLKYKLQE